MAKRKKSHHKKHRRVGALNPRSPLVIGASIAAGYFADQFIGINSMIDKMLPGSIVTPATATTKEVVTPTATMGNVAMAGELGLGAYLLLSKNKSTVKTLAGGFAAGLGARRLLKEMKVISGYQSTPVIGKRRHVRGYQDTPVIGGVPAMLSGTPPMLSGYTPSGSGVGAYRSAGSGVMGGVGGGSGITTGSGYMQ